VGRSSLAIHADRIWLVSSAKTKAFHILAKLLFNRRSRAPVGGAIGRFRVDAPTLPTASVVGCPKSLQHKLFGPGGGDDRGLLGGGAGANGLTSLGRRCRHQRRVTAGSYASLNALATASGVQHWPRGARPRAAGLGAGRPSRTVECRTDADDRTVEDAARPTSVLVRD
jgi:hypothetical protein